jgi:hypothetical protein
MNGDTALQETNDSWCFLERLFSVKAWSVVFMNCYIHIS